MLYVSTKLFFTQKVVENHCFVISCMPELQKMSFRYRRGKLVRIVSPDFLALTYFPIPSLVPNTKQQFGNYHTHLTYRPLFTLHYCLHKLGYNTLSLVCRHGIDFVCALYICIVIRLT